MKRIFAAVDLSEAARGRAARYIETLRAEFPRVRVGWERAEKLHLTLKFFGDADAIQIAGLETILVKIAAQTSVIKLRLANPGVFPNAHKPRVLWLDVIDERRSLMEINRILERECLEIGFPKEKRGFRPHLTIGRIREPSTATALAAKHLRNNFDGVTFEVTEIVIYESRLLATGSVYTKIIRSSIVIRP